MEEDLYSIAYKVGTPEWSTAKTGRPPLLTSLSGIVFDWLDGYEGMPALFKFMEETAPTVGWYPATYSAVGATTYNMARALWSIFGPWQSCRMHR